MIRTTYLLLLLVAVMASCRDDSFTSSSIYTDPPTVEDIYVKNLQGLVVDTNLDPVANAIVQVDNRTVTTNNEGVWSLKEVPINAKRGTYVSVEADRHFAGGNRLYSNNGAKSEVVTQLVPFPSALTIGSDAPEEVSIEGARIDFTKTQFITSTGLAYQGDVDVYAYHLDPSDTDFLTRSPGDLSASNVDGEAVGLQSYGMLAVELRSPAGEELQLADNTSASITLDVPDKLQPTAPTSIPLWSYDEVIGTWIEEGRAQLQGNVYVGEVSHFSWWNCDIEIDPVLVCIELIQPESISELEGVRISLCDDLLGTAMGTTDATGTLCGIVPRDRVITLKVMDACGNIVYMEEVGPFTADASITIDYSPDPSQFATLEGAITSCTAGLDLSDMIVTIRTPYDHFLATVDDQGNYVATLELCESSAPYSVSAISIANQVSGFENRVATAAGPNLVDVDICDGVPLIAFYDDNDNIIYTAATVSLAVKPHETLITVPNGVIGWSGSDVGTFPVNVIIQDNATGSNIILDNVRNSSTIVITNWGPVGTLISGTISGSGGFPSTSAGPITGEFIARRIE